MCMVIEAAVLVQSWKHLRELHQQQPLRVPLDFEDLISDVLLVNSYCYFSFVGSGGTLWYIQNVRIQHEDFSGLSS